MDPPKPCATAPPAHIPPPPSRGYGPHHVRDSTPAPPRPPRRQATLTSTRATPNGNHLTMKVAPDNGDEGGGAEVLTCEAAVTPAK
ncbi:hypothetical protein C9424_08330 [Arthrobacter sp. H-02-3]|nr:hypothetical protein C9424_08330 [Arthrobacter sp. H-02-3]